MAELISGGVFLKGGRTLLRDAGNITPEEARKNTIAYGILSAHNLSDDDNALKLRFGLDDGNQRTLEEVGREFKVTRERIRQIEAKALRKLRHPSRSRKLKESLD